MTNWLQASFKPQDAAITALQAHWRWLLGDDWQPFLFSSIGDVFLTVAAGSVWWLSTATGSLEHIADSREHFSVLLEGESADEWFLPGLAAALCAHGKPLGDGECYSYTVFPVFEHGSFSVENMFATPAVDHFATSGRLHESIRSLPDGSEAVVLLADNTIAH